MTTTEAQSPSESAAAPPEAPPSLEQLLALRRQQLRESYGDHAKQALDKDWERFAERIGLTIASKAMKVGCYAEDATERRHLLRGVSERAVHEALTELGL